MFEHSWIPGVALAGASVVLVGSGIGLLATSMAAPTTAPRPAVLLLPQDGAGAIHTGYSTVTVKKQDFDERLKGNPEAKPGR
ncbi:hypothetical protein ACFV0H_10345 [Streptomyces erythrochromogenes]|uniref:Uncharacterized protein n=1 Tax=Streptomyces erythrochromogenes TaxID=285574 RepID=A0ABZ1QJA4_9ACTN|nr:hypothetical protein [Streptomyces erythrochromogenes]MCX5588288.1 hypothetical protein [Streptomyces erythrochromogenes]